MSVPPYLYKYRRFNQYFLNEVCDGSIYFASPESFNDPLDTKPSLVGDSSEQDKESLFRALYLSQFSNKDVASKISELRYLSTEHGDANQKYNYDRLLMSRIENIFLKPAKHRLKSEL